MAEISGVQSGSRPADRAQVKQARRSDRRFARPVRLAIMLVVPIILWAAVFVAVRAMF
ncbi:hypothetical protein J3454_08660 [Erythrobacter sp. NFXS35]|uniref:hypothetical protein n=1 Tax=Erythrobacter sp. NFXS35 TaxID=2818436 RepID=UPI0032E01CD2